MSNIKEVEHELKINSSIQIIENISISLLETAGKMFLYLNSCPDHLKPWFFMYTDLFQSQTANQIILTLNRILKVDDSHQNKALKTIAAKLFDRITTLFALKYREIQRMTIGQEISNFHGSENPNNFSGQTFS